jgi:dTDP-glucose pyrophosphorylase
MDVKNLIISQERTLIEALDQLNRILYIDSISRLILFVVDTSQKVVGSVTDGDVRRALVKHQNINLKVGDICNPDFLFEHETNGFLDLSYYRKKDIKILPMLDTHKQLVRIIDLDNIKSQLPLECMIMAGGRGKRLSPFTDEVPKPMLPLGGKPIIEHNINRLISFGIKKIYISVKYLGEQIQDYFGDGSSKGISIEYIWEDKPLGTAGALALVNEFSTEHVLLMNSDLFTNVDFEEMYLKLINEKADMVVASTEYKVDVPYAILEDHNNQQVKAFKEKPSYIYHSNAGIYMLSKQVIQTIPKQEFCDITDVMQQLISQQKKLIHCPIIGYWIDIGKPIDYKQAQEFIKHL